ncbi:MAG: pyruvate, phosphate dikinase [Bacteroidia bacterium]|nr:pyruvate, phosphate dikinase [Bacteroidia bacterium]
MEEPIHNHRGKKLVNENMEQLKELAAINTVTNILKEGKSTEETLQEICLTLPAAWQYPEHTVARISYNNMEFCSYGFKETAWCQEQSIEIIDNKKGKIQIFYTQKFSDEYEGPFLIEERHLIDHLAGIISGYLNSKKDNSIYERSREQFFRTRETEKPASAKNSHQLLQKFLNKNNFDRDIYHDLMPFKVKEILLVANLYDAYSIEKEGRFSEHVLGEYHQLNLTSLPRITGVTTSDEAFEQLYSKHFDLVIMMLGVDKRTPMEMGKKIKQLFPYIPVFILLNNNRDLAIFKDDSGKLSLIDKIFIWNGESQVIFAMIKSVEDIINVKNDTKFGMVRVILLVEDSPIYYSRYLPMLYHIVMEQTRRIIDDVSTDELYKVLRMRARPKILMVHNYEDAKEIIENYRDFMLCLISDVSFESGGTTDPLAGFKLVQYAKSLIKDLPCIIQSSDKENARRAFELKSSFIDKNSESLMHDIRSFITHYLGFGNFIYRNKDGEQIAEARTLREFENQLFTIPDESLIYHARKDHFSLWLMARGEIQAAKILNPAKVTDFENPDHLRQYLIETIQKFRNEQSRGKVIPFEDDTIIDESNVVSLMPGLMGGKGRGISFINTLINYYGFHQYVPDINIRSPKTAIIGTEEFEYFIVHNRLLDKAIAETDYSVIKQWFLGCSLSDGLVKKLGILLHQISKPLAVRSSGLFEDSLMQPFAGIFETYMIPNNHPDINVRLEQLMDAVRLVFASVFSPTAKGYFDAISYKVEEEKMAVIIQEVVGNQYENVYYPHISGVAQSFNYYPFGHIQPEDGFANLAIGLGKYVVEGEKTYRFTPAYPSLEINTPKDQSKNTQVEFIAVDLNQKEINLAEGDEAGLIRLDIGTAEKHGNLMHCSSVYDPDNFTITPGLDKPGPRVVNFADILKYNYIPLSDTISVVLDVVKEALGSPVEIEFAIDLNRDADNRSSFYLLQIKPLIGSAQDYIIDTEEIERSHILLYSEKGMGNGVINEIFDVIFVKPSSFDKSMTLEMASEIDHLNSVMIAEKRKYILIGPGRWGTRDRWIGIPVTWPQISNAKMIAETSMDDFPLDASSGSHFFHNVTSMNVGYCSVQHESENYHIAWDVLQNMKSLHETRFFRHVAFDSPLTIRMDGKKRISLITWGEKI